ncbi:MAG: hypothetical protein FD138_3738 [Planctomycetota bacterium]|nr:MAG: hypothetical protein FD138_3738 [Planctomycetota bacterium]
MPILIELSTDLVSTDSDDRRFFEIQPFVQRLGGHYCEEMQQGRSRSQIAAAIAPMRFETRSQPVFT